MKIGTRIFLILVALIRSTPKGRHKDVVIIDGTTPKLKKSTSSPPATQPQITLTPPVAIAPEISPPSTPQAPQPVKYVESPDAAYLQAAEKLEKEYTNKKGTLLSTKKKKPRKEKQRKTRSHEQSSPPPPSSAILLVLEDEEDEEDNKVPDVAEDDSSSYASQETKAPESTDFLTSSAPTNPSNSPPSRLSLSKKPTSATNTATMQKATLSNLSSTSLSQPQPKVSVPQAPPPKPKPLKKPTKPKPVSQAVPQDATIPLPSGKILKTNTNPPKQQPINKTAPPKATNSEKVKPQPINWAFLRQLNPKQQEAVTKDLSKPLVILAGAGSGKTFTLCSRIAYILSQGVPAHQIIALTFTRAAAEELKKRVKKMIIDDGHKNFGFNLQEQFYLTTGTFHSICFSILNIHCEHLGFTSGKPTICGDKKIEVIVKEALNAWERKKGEGGIAATAENHDKARGSLGEDEKQTGEITKNDVDVYVNFIRRAKSDGKEPHEYGGDNAFIYQFYQDRLKKTNSIDFTDMIRLTVKLFKEQPKILELYRDKHRFILVDEFQV